MLTRARRSPTISLRAWNPVSRSHPPSATDVLILPIVTAGALEPALKLYERSKAGGIDRAEQNIRNVSLRFRARCFPA